MLTGRGRCGIETGRSQASRGPRCLGRRERSGPPGCRISVRHPTLWSFDPGWWGPWLRSWRRQGGQRRCRESPGHQLPQASSGKAVFLSPEGEGVGVSRISAPLRPAATGEHCAGLSPTAGASSPDAGRLCLDLWVLCRGMPLAQTENCPLLAASPLLSVPLPQERGTLNNDEMMQTTENEDNDGDCA